MKYISFLLALFFLFSCAKEPEEIDPFIYKSGSLKQGETLAEALKQKDIKNTDVYKLVNKLDEIYNLRRSHPGDSFKV